MTNLLLWLIALASASIVQFLPRNGIRLEEHKAAAEEIEFTEIGRDLLSCLGMFEIVRNDEELPPDLGRPLVLLIDSGMDDQLHVYTKMYSTIVWETSPQSQCNGTFQLAVVSVTQDADDDDNAELKNAEDRWVSVLENASSLTPVRDGVFAMESRGIKHRIIIRKIGTA
eukprot:Gregarina_sp_Poly_1__5069@NODE_2688_length_1823_cov_552_005125_g1705_i0_p2_GENE_NODE_2688_length_1823_cov_552_005125_g1705_i0NODE_2688_length_1823_cov_552_005125_g1705_i0_p2_ORF_typecomplete_len170_score23_65_NODE_2688_length_1823_cov_552_005125_g1705_i011381647